MVMDTLKFFKFLPDVYVYTDCVHWISIVWKVSCHKFLNTLFIFLT